MAISLTLTRLNRLFLAGKRYQRTFTTSSYNFQKKGLVLGVYVDEDAVSLTPTAQAFDQCIQGKLLNHIKLVEKELKPGRSFLFWNLDQKFQSVAVVSLGKRTDGLDENECINTNKEAVRIASAAGCKSLNAAGIKEIYVESLEDAQAAAEGGILGTWKFQEYKTKKDPLPSVELYEECKDCSSEWKKGALWAQAQNIARSLVDTPSNLLTPTIFVEKAHEIIGSGDISIKDYDEKWAAKEGMNAFLAVAKGSKEPPKFLEITYRSKDASEKPIVLVGKGVTFDAGGISLKPASKMDEMRGDMGGAACVLATLYAITRLGIPAHVTVLIPLVENLPSGTAVKPGDVIRAKNGKSICVDNTDAEGRLILADALCYTEKFGPRNVVDVATLTGAMRVALGSGATGVFSNSDDLFSALQKCGSNTGDRVWRLPLWKHYTKQVAENNAYDLNNIGKGLGGGSCTAAAFLKEFVPKSTPWMHLDIAGVMGPQPDPSVPYLDKGMTGRPTRTLIEFVENQACSSRS